jgi:hypothetical protein
VEEIPYLARNSPPLDKPKFAQAQALLIGVLPAAQPEGGCEVVVIHALRMHL